MNTKTAPIVVAVSSRALFNLELEHSIFQTQGIDKYRQYQIEHQNSPLEPGVAFPFIKRLLKINTLFPNGEPFRVVAISRNSPETAQRFFSSCRYYNLQIKAGAFTSGQPTFPYLKSFDVSLFLSADRENVNKSINLGLPAGLVLPTLNNNAKIIDVSDTELRIAFDFDGVIVDDEAEKEFKKNGIEGFEQYEISHIEQPHSPGPLSKLFKKLSEFQSLDAKRAVDNSEYKPSIRISIVTARGAPSEQRLITTLKALGMSAAELFLLDGLPKKNVLDVLKPHIYFDDHLTHLEGASIPCVLVPFGVRNL